ncbi:MAG: hypothetical protein P1S46_04820 [bacterium]|nr:hypothetical protein [bacterium]MDT8395294.1 hypothetical protein [bacterium]
MNPKAKKYIRNSLILASLVGVFWAVPFMNIMRLYPEYRGLVVDSETGRPIEKAQVIAIYEFEIGSPGGPSSAFLNYFATWTDGKGRFRIPRRLYFKLLLFGWFAEHPKVEIFKNGYGNYPMILHASDSKGELVQGPPGWDYPAAWLPPNRDVVFRLHISETPDDEKRRERSAIFLSHIPLKVRQILQEKGFDI